MSEWAAPSLRGWKPSEPGAPDVAACTASSASGRLKRKSASGVGAAAANDRRMASGSPSAVGIPSAGQKSGKEGTELD